MNRLADPQCSRRRAPVDKFAQRRSELAAAALQDPLRARLRPDVASVRSPQNSEFSHGVLHYYFPTRST